jgi:hypothetical protein
VSASASRCGRAASSAATASRAARSGSASSTTCAAGARSGSRSNTISRTDVSPIYVDAVGTSPDTSARHTLSLVLRRNAINAITRGGGTISENGIGIHAPIHGSRLVVTSTGNRITGKIPSGGAVLAVFYDVPRWPRGSSYHGFGNSYRDLNRGSGTRFKAPGIRRPYGLREFGSALGLGGIAARFREAGSRIAPR